MSEKEKKGKKAMPAKKATPETVSQELAQEMPEDAPQDMPEHTVELMQSEDAAEIFGDALLEEARRLAQEKENLFQQHLRLQADFDNFRKRSRHEREDMVKLAATALMQDLLPVLDNFERALCALAESSESEGIRLIYRQFMDVLASAGLTPIE
ncbi:MAG: nucleotide exchange factor GrpE, partial [Clostridiales bacterium]|nr:nucleotide exchange factor GrpE [Clostridiales bacterium]